MLSISISTCGRPYVTAFHLSTRIVKPLTLKSANGIKVNSLNLEMDCFKGSDGYYYKGSLEVGWCRLNPGCWKKLPRLLLF